MTRLTDLNDVAESRAAFSSAALWSLFDGDRESMNLALSQNRAQSVLAALRDRRILTGTFKATGFGEASPIADNGTEEGREANRRIEFVLIQPEAVSAEEAEAETQESLENGGDPVNEEAETGEAAEQETGENVEN